MSFNNVLQLSDNLSSLKNQIRLEFLVSFEHIITQA